MVFPLRLVLYPFNTSIQHCCYATSTTFTVRSELEDEFRVSFREGAMGMTLSMDPDSRDAIVGKIVEQGQAFRAVRLTTEQRQQRDTLSFFGVLVPGSDGSSRGARGHAAGIVGYTFSYVQSGYKTRTRHPLHLSPSTSLSLYIHLS